MEPRLSVVVVSYNMAREIPRTVRSLSPRMQRGIAAEDYEIIIVDNGSTRPFDEDECRRWRPDITVHRMTDATHSPTPAVNKGIALARGDLVGVLVDGARMSSPGLLSLALEAARLREWPVIGTVGYHIGPDVQPKSIHQGYNQAVEDELLASVNWAEDGYRLFGISTLANSSSFGWFLLPGESNALFMRKAHWEKLGGFDEGFTSPGGGLSNADLWARACADVGGDVIMLLGEATFHQVHGGAATNAPASMAPVYLEEYLQLRGKRWTGPEADPVFYGRLRSEALQSVTRSFERWTNSVNGVKK